ncbi:MFS transporter [Fodinicola acaciae]|uniref:MFS transporter n=1 Tax=Fodinicola acaciae TaxID=2681555 RepID=UPI001C9E95EB|nr:MFS transporter [Fodinicola acaciae]
MKWGTLGVACLAMLMLALDLTVLHLAVPKLTAELAPTSTQLLWIVDAYGFALAGLLVTMGNIGDRIGRKKLLLVGAATFGVASVITAYAPTAELLIAARALLGVAGATIMPSTLSLVRNVFTDPKERTAAIGLWNGVAIAGFGLGPLIGGALLDHFWWGSVFLINVPVVLLILVAGGIVLPESRNPSPGRLDWLSVPLSIVGVVAVVYAIKQAAHNGFTAEVLISLAVGVVTIIVFIRRQTRLPEPLIDVRLFRRGPFSLTVGAALAAMFAQLAISLVLAQYLQLVLGWSPLLAGVAGLPAIVAAVAGALMSPAAINVLGRAATMTAGLVLSAIGMVLYGLLGLRPTYGYLLVTMLIFGLAWR